MRNLFCFFGFHKIKFVNPFATVCQNKCCNELKEIHSNSSSKETWSLKHQDGDYWVTTRKSKIKNLKQAFGLIPIEGSKIKITWLPYNNGYPEKNVYIGSEGIVEHLDLESGSFSLNMGNSYLTIGVGRNKKKAEYKFIYLD